MGRLSARPLVAAVLAAAVVASLLPAQAAATHAPMRGRGLLGAHELCPGSSELVRVMAFGDSLTNGAVPSLNSNHPYAWKLEQLMKSELNRNVWVKVVAANSAGTMMTGIDNDGKPIDLLALMERDLGEGNRYDVSILLSGTNDLGRGNKTAPAVFDHFVNRLLNPAMKVTKYAVIIITPWANLFVDRNSDNEWQRQKFHDLLYNHVKPYEGKGAPVLLLDEIESSEFKFWDMPEEQRRRYQDDMLHLTQEGYEVLGAHLFNLMKTSGVLKEVQCGWPRRPTPPPSPPKPAATMVARAMADNASPVPASANPTPALPANASTATANASAAAKPAPLQTSGASMWSTPRALGVAAAVAAVALMY